MEIVRDAGIVVDWCKTCNGLWFDMGELNRYITDKKAPENFIKNCICTKGTLPCPVCWEPMDEVRAGQLVIDRCTQCRGLWFDAGEVGALKGIMSTSGGPMKEGLADGMAGHMILSTDYYPGGEIGDPPDKAATEGGAEADDTAGGLAIDVLDSTMEAAEIVGKPVVVVADILSGIMDVVP